jgi:hypothetical protein
LGAAQGCEVPGLIAFGERNRQAVHPVRKLKRALLFLGLVTCASLIGTAQASSTSSGTLVKSLDGEWQSAWDLKDAGRTGKWFDPTLFPVKDARPALVPGSGMETWPITSWWMDAPTNILWYLKTFPLEMTPQAGMQYYLRFGAVKKLSEVWFNGTSLGTHEGGEDPFEFDVTSLLQPGKPNTVAVRLQMAMQGGMNQHVTLVAQPDVRILDAFARPDAKAGLIHLEVTVENNTKSPAQVGVSALLGEFKPVRALPGGATTLTVPPGQTVVKLDLPVKHPHLWDLNDPFLYTIKVTSDWKAVGGDATLHDTYSFRTGFRDIRMVDGYFCLNGRRIFLKSLHGNFCDPIALQGTPRDMTYLGRDFPQLKKAGFNTMRFIMSAAMPEQLDQADELGFLIFSEHESSWLCKDPNKFGITLNQIVRRDRNHPSLILWGLLNETADLGVYKKAKDWLPSLRALDDTRPVLLSSGRWDKDHKTASISNTGSPTWDVYLGGEDAQNPKPTGRLRGEESWLNDASDGTGDDHVYPWYPLSWDFITDFGKLDQDNPHPFFLSECGIGSSFNPIEEKRELEKAHAPPTCLSWSWANAGVDGITKAYATYGLSETYPKMEDIFVDSALEAARQRELIFTIVRGNPKVNGYSLTSLQDFFGAGEGVMNNFREFKPGHLKVLQAGWAPLRWCLLVNPTNVYADQPLRIKVSLANEDALPAGDYPATLDISGPAGVVWKQSVIAHVQQNGPFAYSLFDDDVRVPNLKDGTYALEASLDNKPNGASSRLPFTVTTRASLPAISGAITVTGLGQNVRDLLTKQGAKLHDYAQKEEIDRETIVVGADFKGNAYDWRALYARAARGAHLVFLAGAILQADNAPDKWLPLPGKGHPYPDKDWLYHKDVIGKVNHPLLAGLPTKLMSPEYYGNLLADTHHFQGVTLPADTAAVAIYSSLTDHYHFFDGVMLGTYPFHAGHFTLNAFNIAGSIGNPATHRLLLNLVAQAQADAAPLAALPADYDAEMDKFGFTDPSPPAPAPAK